MDFSEIIDSVGNNEKSKFTETQIVSILKETDAGIKVDDVCRKYGISSAMYYNWKSKYGGIQASDIKKFKELQDENGCLKKRCAELSLENRAFKELFEKRVGGSRKTRCSFRLCRLWRQYLQSL